VAAHGGRKPPPHARSLKPNATQTIGPNPVPTWAAVTAQPAARLFAALAFQIEAKPLNTDNKMAVNNGNM